MPRNRADKTDDAANFSKCFPRRGTTGANRWRSTPAWLALACLFGTSFRSAPLHEDGFCDAVFQFSRRHGGVVFFSACQAAFPGKRRAHSQRGSDRNRRPGKHPSYRPRHCGSLFALLFLFFMRRPPNCSKPGGLLALVSQPEMAGETGNVVDDLVDRIRAGRCLGLFDQLLAGFLHLGDAQA